MAKRLPSAKQPSLFAETEPSFPPPDTHPPTPSPSASQGDPEAFGDPLKGAGSGIGKGLGAGELVIAVDSHSLLYQVFHAMPTMSSPSGQAVQAVYGFLRDLADLRDRLAPDFLVCTFDASEETFRNTIYPPYKQHRDPMPEELRSQIPIVLKLLELLRIPVLQLGGYEADDLLATIADEVERAGARCLLVTSDKDCRQLLSDQVQLYLIRKSMIYGEAQLREEWGIGPSQVIDYQGLVGDSVDNIPGVPSIGPKTATELLGKYPTLEVLYEHLEEISSAKRKQTLATYRDQAFLSRLLSALRRDVPIDLAWGPWRDLKPDAAPAGELFQQLGFKGLAKRWLDAQSVADSPSAAHSPATDYRTIQSLQQLEEVVGICRKAPWVSFDSETTGLQPRDAKPVGYSLAWEIGCAAYIPLMAPSGTTTLAADQVHERLKPLLENPKIRKIGQHLKFDAILLRSQGIHLRGIEFDTMVADYLLDAGQRNHSLGEIAKRVLDRDSIPISDLIGTGKQQSTMDQVPLEKISYYACEDADLPLQLHPVLQPRIQQQGLESVFRDLELPLIDVLAAMEYQGIAVDVERLRSLSDRFGKRIESIRQEIEQMAGGHFNPESPKQLAKVLFEELQLPIVKKTKTGPSTDAEVLQELASKHPLPAKILELRQAVKLKSTYLDALPEQISPVTGRIHTSFRQDVAATGRLSSVDPNLQNIPVRTQEGKEIRSAFRASQPDWLLLKADYSQIELRILAHYSQDAAMLKAFHDGLDIHAQVASQVYGVPIDQVHSDQRRSAKAINFGILYGQSPFGLAKALQIPQDEASRFIDQYFARFPGVVDFMERTIMECRRQGFVQTLSGRKRWIQGVRDFATLEPRKKKVLLEPERMAVNTVIQGSAADLIKMAMIAIHRQLEESSTLDARMLLQIHDELIFEVSPAARDRLAQLVAKEMTEAVKLSVPLEIELQAGSSWGECEKLTL
jgi:DNA polymerase-1